MNTAPIHFRIEATDLNAHLFHITLRIAKPKTLQKLSLPVWVPGSYLIREFSKHLQGLQAHQGQQELEVEQLDKCSWQVRCDRKQALTLNYQVYAHDDSVRTAWLDSTRGFFNASSLCLAVCDQDHVPHDVELRCPSLCSSWMVATALPAHRIDDQGWGCYRASDYDELVDSPVEMGHFWQGSFVVAGVSHRLVVTGAAPSFEGERLLQDAQKICSAAVSFWHPKGHPPHNHYLFLLHATSQGYGGLEHKNCSVLTCKRSDLPQRGVIKRPEGYNALLGLISHEYFHTWCVKRLRPAQLARYNYTCENYTDLLWFFEGFTSYYDDLLVRRAGLIDDAHYLQELNQTINQVLQTPGTVVQSLAQASFDAWVKFYRPDDNTPNATVSYYAKGALVALCLDLTLRREGRTTLDDVMRAVWHHCQGGPMAEADLTQVLEQLSGRSFNTEIKRWVHGVGDLPLQELLQTHGVVVYQDPSQWTQCLGLRLKEGTGLRIKTVLRGGPAEQAGFAPGDEWLGIDLGLGGSATVDAEHCGWRLEKLDELPFYLGPRTSLQALVVRDQRLLRLTLELPERSTTWRLAVGDTEPLRRWLGNGVAQTNA